MQNAQHTMPSTKTVCLIIINDGDYFARHKAALMEPLLGQMQVTVASGGSLDGIPKSFNAERVHVSRRMFSPVSDVKLLASLLAMFRRKKPELVISFTMKPTVFGLLAAMLPFSGLSRKCRFVCEFPGLGVLFERRGAASAIARKLSTGMVRIAARRLNLHIVFENLADREHFVSLGYVKMQQTTVLSGTGIDLSAYALPSARDPDVVNVLWAGRLITGKGLDLFCDAAEKLSAEGNSHVRFLVAGLPDVQSAEAISPETLAGLVTRPCITFLGHDRNIPELLSRVDIICHPSRYREGLPRILLEAAASGVAIVASENFGTRQIVTHGETGLLTAELTSDGVAGELRRLIRDPLLRKQLADAALKRVNSGGFDTQHVMRELFSVLNSPKPLEN
jgi:glycosyltransferase involved in cell wall biosynthesis